MTDITRILAQISDGDPSGVEQLLPLVYDELRKLAAAKMAQERPGQTLQATALVHEAYLRLVDQEKAPHWNSRGHFFATAAEAMRRILVEQARRKAGPEAGGGRYRVDIILALVDSSRKPRRGEDWDERQVVGRGSHLQGGPQDSVLRSSRRVSGAGLRR